MCGVCGCSEPSNSNIVHAHSHDDAHTIPIEQAILAKNDGYAHENRHRFDAAPCLAVNLMSSPGAGKTTLLQSTLKALAPQTPCNVIVGDQQTDADAKQLQAHGAQALQINTGHICHLDAHMLGHALDKTSLPEQGILFIENIGNLVCPAMFALGEHCRVVLLSVTEGENKPIKYPDMFRHADIVLLTKSDLLPYLDFDLEQCKSYIKQVQPKADILCVSSKNGEGMNVWVQWLQQQRCQRQ